MLAIKLIVEGLGLGFLLYLICAMGVRNGAIGMVHLYDRKVQERVVELGLTTAEQIRKRSIWFRSLCLSGYLIYVLLCALGFVGVIVYGGWDGVRKGFTFGQFLVRFLVILLGMKAFDIIVLDYILITKTQFFQHYIPETKGCAGYHSFGYNRKEQFWRIVTLPFAALLAAWICTLF